MLISTEIEIKHIGKKRKTHEKFVEELKIMNPNIEVLGKYTMALDKIKVKCKIDGYIWYATPGNLLSKRGCPVCSNNIVMKGINDMWTTDCKQAKLLYNPEDGYQYTKGSIVKVDWICPKCGCIVNDVRISDVHNHGLSCKKCSDGISFPERLLTNVLLYVENNFETHKKFSWSDGRIYDYFIKTCNTIIEINGSQHTGKGFSTLGGRTLKEEQENDRYKEQLAKENGIKNYIIINAPKSDLILIKNSILQSDLEHIYDLSNIDWEQAYKNSLKSIVVLSSNLWNSGMDVSKIANILKLSKSGVVKYLKRARDINICSYNSDEQLKLSYIKMHKATIKSCICLNTLVIYKSLSQASLFCAIDNSSLSSCCGGKRNSAGKSINGEPLTWMYYDKYLELQTK